MCLLGLNSNHNFKNKQTMLRYNHVSCSWHSFFFGGGHFLLHQAMNLAVKLWQGRRDRAGWIAPLKMRCGATQGERCEKRHERRWLLNSGLFKCQCANALEFQRVQMLCNLFEF